VWEYQAINSRSCCGAKQHPKLLFSQFVATKISVVHHVVTTRDCTWMRQLALSCLAVPNTTFPYRATKKHSNQPYKVLQPDFLLALGIPVTPTPGNASPRPVSGEQAPYVVLLSPLYECIVSTGSELLALSDGDLLLTGILCCRAHQQLCLAAQAHSPLFLLSTLLTPIFPTTSVSCLYTNTLRPLETRTSSPVQCRCSCHTASRGVVHRHCTRARRACRTASQQQDELL
jgi:hypothetical protein